MKLVFSMSILVCSTALNSEPYHTRNINHTEVHWLWGNLSDTTDRRSASLITRTQNCVDALLSHINPPALNATNHSNRFLGNCTILFNDRVEEVNCTFEPSNQGVKNQKAARLPSVRLPTEYYFQIAVSNILTTLIQADWTAGHYQQQWNQLWFRQSPCTETQTITNSLEVTPTIRYKPVSETHQLTGSLFDTFSRSVQLSKSWLASFTRTQPLTPSVELDSTNTRSNSLPSTFSHQLSRTRSGESRQTTENLSVSHSKPSKTSSLSLSSSFSKTISESSSSSVQGSLSRTASEPVIWNPEWANWDVTTGVYKDATNQTGRYNESTPGIVTDFMTGLQWQKGLAPGLYNWTNASTYCDGLFLGGYADWRLPTRIELESLVDYTMNYQGVAPSINNNAFVDTPVDYFWSSPSLANHSGFYWYVSFGLNALYAGLVCSHNISGCAVSNLGYARCVRPLSTIESMDRYHNEAAKTLNANSTQVQDLLTGLIWQRGFVSAKTWNPSFSIGSAQEYCNKLVLGNEGEGKWRLPSIKELSTLANFSVISPDLMMNTTSFSGNPADWFWSSTRVSGHSGDNIWSVNFGSGKIQYIGGGGNTVYTKCVRSPNLIANPQWANWDQATGVYGDATNQTDRYLESRPEIITDSLTGLHWQKNSSNQTYLWNDAKGYCDSLFLSGYGDWRLPTHVELQSLVDYTKEGSGPVISGNYFPNTTKSFYWSSDPLIGYSGSAWWVGFGNLTTLYGGAINSQGYGNGLPAGYIRCVRPQASVSLGDRYRDESGGVLTAANTQVLDRVTGLTWQRLVSGTYNLSSALSYCNDLKLGGYLWRLPTVKELSTLLDVRIASPGPTINETAFPNMPSAPRRFRSTTTTNDGFAWYVDYYYGVVNVDEIWNLYSARCVRAPLVYSSNLPSWPVFSGVYADATNQSNRYIEENPGIITDSFTGLKWEEHPEQTAYNASQAQSHCNNIVKANQANWRMPTRTELQSLVDYTLGCSGPAVNTTEFLNTQRSIYWSSNSNEFVNFKDGSADTSTNSSQPGYVRCVKPDAIQVTMDRYRDENFYVLNSQSNQVMDMNTLLVWQRDESAPLNWSNAVSYCSSLGLNWQNWRLPTVKELSSLLNISAASGPALNQTAFPNSTSDSFWTSTPSSCNSSKAWRVDFGNTSVNSDTLSNGASARCVRSCPLPPTNGLLAAWDSRTGVYADATNQTNRYQISNGIVLDTLTNIQWQQNTSVSPMNFTQAQAYCAAQTTGGLVGWRIPNIVELGTLIDYTTLTPPFLNTIVFQGASSSDYWSGSSDIGNSGYSWFVRTSIGYPYSYYQITSTTNQVLCVRSCYPALPSLRDVVGTATASGTVADKVTGLIWQQVSPSTNYTQSNAVSYCRGLSLGGYSSGWRLPTVRELQTLIDYSGNYNSLMMDPSFSGEAANWFWSSTTLASVPTNALRVGFFNGNLDGNNVGGTCYARCVRDLCPVPPTNGLLAVWPASTGVYSDATNQTNRYLVSNGVVNDTLTGILWEQYPSSTNMTFPQAKTYCAGRRTGDLVGWRVPNIVELTTLYDYTSASPHVNTAVFPETKAVNYWSSSPEIGNGGGNAWDLELGNELTFYRTTGTLNQVRCVVSCYPTAPSTRYTVASGEVTDLVTGLVWQQHAPLTANKNQTDAKTYCTTLGLNGNSWRLPTARELQTLTDYSVGLHTLMMNPVFSGESVDWFWSSTVLKSNSSWGWYASVDNGDLAKTPASELGHVRCVRP